MKTILLYCCHHGPLSWLNEELMNIGPVGEVELPISDSLRAQLADFNHWHLELCESGEGVASQLDQRLYDEKGLALWEQLQTELGSEYRILHPSHEFGKELEDSPGKLRAAQKRTPYA